MQQTIYKITSPTGKCYIGRTTRYNGRMDEHRWLAEEKNSDFIIHKAIRKYGWDNMKKEILCNAPNKETAIELEEYFIKEYDAVDSGYNMTYAGHGGNVFKWNPELKEKQRISLSKRFSGESNPMFGKNHSAETKKKQKQKAKGRFSLPWFIERNGKEEGTKLYEERNAKLKARKLPTDSMGRFVKSK